MRRVCARWMKNPSNADEPIARFRDEACCRAIAENVGQVATAELTHARPIDRFHEALAGVM